MKKILKIVPFIIITILVGVTVAYAGSLTPPGSVANTMYSLTDIFNLSAGRTTTLGSGTIATTPGSVVATGKTLTEIYDVISTQIGNLANGKIAKDITAFGFTGTLYGDTDASKVLTTARYPGTATAGVSYPTLWSADATGYVNWATAVAYCANLTEGSVAPGTWHLPTYIELVNAYLTSVVGFQVDWNMYWSGTTDLLDSDGAYLVNMNFALALFDAKTAPDYRARCAR